MSGEWTTLRRLKGTVIYSLLTTHCSHFFFWRKFPRILLEHHGDVVLDRVGEAGPGEVRIRVQQVGVCGTDLHIHNGDFNAVFPLIPGHELVGVVDAIG